MIDLHTHTLLSDGELLPSELVRRAEAAGYEAIALTDHVDSSNMDFVLPRLVRVSRDLNRYWKIRVIPGVEITHVPLEMIKPLVKKARMSGARIVVVHGETVSEPVIPGTNRRAIESRCDILAHPGLISRADAELAAKLGVYLELTARRGHSAANKHVFKIAKKAGAELVLNTDSHAPGDVITDVKAVDFLRKTVGLDKSEISRIYANMHMLSKKALSGG